MPTGLTDSLEICSRTFSAPPRVAQSAGTAAYRLDEAAQPRRSETYRGEHCQAAGAAQGMSFHERRGPLLFAFIGLVAAIAVIVWAMAL